MKLCHLNHYNDLDNLVKPISYYFLTNTSTELEYRNAYITIPANSNFIISVKVTYNVSAPLCVALCLSNNIYQEVASQKNGYYHSTVTYSGYVDTETTYYIWAKYQDEYNNLESEIMITGFIL